MDMFVTHSETDSLRGLLLLFAIVALIVALRAITIGGGLHATDAEPVDSAAPTQFAGE